MIEVHITLAGITGLTYRKCKKCGRRVGLTYDITGQLRAFKP